MWLLLIVAIVCFGIYLEIKKQCPSEPKYDPPKPLSPEEEETARQQSEIANRKLEKERQAKWNELANIINADASVLAIKRRQLVYSDSYGIEKIEPWMKEVEYYIQIRGLEKYIRPGFSFSYDHQSGFSIDEIVQLIDTVAKSTQVQNVSPNSDPLEFERQCAETLQRIGWSTQLTARTGDQGIDIIAKKKRIKVVVQCKLYAKPVGNGAVQEIAAGRSFESADYAVVVTTSGFTKSARTLAKNTQVLLLDFAELAELDSRLSI